MSEEREEGEEDIPYNFRSSFKEHAFEERLGLSYYLSTSRPLRALQHCIKGLEKPDIAMEITQQRKIHISSNISHLSGLVRRVALESMERQDVLAACIVFLKACSLSTEVLSIDVEAAKRILSSSSKKHDIVELFMTMEEGRNQTAILEALRLLGESTAELVKRKAPTKQSFEYPESPWKLVTLFCRTHGLPRSMAYVFFKTFTLTQIFNTLNIQATYMHKYSSSLSPVTHILIHMLIQIISHTYVTIEPQVKIVGSTERVPYRCVRGSRIVRHV